jgi:oxygen-independent coproporphyrinogen-3 oxidase
MLTWTRECLEGAGLAAYEISNFAKPGCESVHNRNYWRYGEYLGFGAGAAGFCRVSDPALHGIRRHNVRNLKKYLGGEVLDFEDVIDRRTAMGEYCMLGLRTREGIDAERFTEAFGAQIEGVFASVLNLWQERKRLVRSGQFWSLTPQGLIFSDEVAASFLK